MPAPKPLFTPPPAPTLLERARGAYLGLAIGDALGATVEFMTAREISLKYGVHDKIIGGGWLHLKPGQITDDTGMTLYLGRAIIASGGWDLKTVCDSFADWMKTRPVDIGNTCRRGIMRFMHEGTLSGELNPGDGGNGALMRNLPAVLATLGHDPLFESLSIAQARLTHHHPLSDAATLGLGQLLRLLLTGADHPSCQSWVAQWVANNPSFGFTPYRGRATAYVVDTVQTVLYFLTQHEDFEAAMVATVNQGDDADTTGALLGMLAGARCGASRLPSRWLQRLRPEVVRAITDQTYGLLALAASVAPGPISAST